MLEIAIKRLQFICDTLPSLLRTISEKDFNHKSLPSKWSKKEILGHLIDSATNNHQRFIRVQFEDNPTIIYDTNNWVSYSDYNNTNNWVSYSDYNNIESAHLIRFWELYNRHLIEIIKRIPTGNLSRELNMNEPTNVRLQWAIEDYVKHMEHHLRQIIEY